MINHTLSTIPNYVKDNVIITTNDGKVIDQSVGYKILLRNDKLSGDDTSTKDVLLDVMEKYNIAVIEIIMMLYLTYPERTWTNIEAALNFFIENDAKSLNGCVILIFVCSVKKQRQANCRTQPISQARLSRVF